MYTVFRRKIDRLFAVAGLSLSLLLSACQPVQPMAETKDAAAVQPIVFELTADGLEAPAEIPSGIVTITYKNSTALPGFIQWGWLNEGYTIADFDKAMQTQDPAGSMNIPIIAGAVSLEPGASKEVSHEVKAGDLFHMGLTFSPDAPPIVPPAQSFKATSASTMARPTADYKVELVDFSFVLPDEITAGKHLWEIHNSGKQHHEISILKLNEGVTVEDVIKLASAQEPPSGPPPFEPIPADVFMGSGTTNWVTLDIPAGEYTVVCWLPNTDDEKMAAHLIHGMVRQLVVK